MNLYKNRLCNSPVLALALLFAVLASCSNDFLEYTPPEIHFTEDTLFVTNDAKHFRHPVYLNNSVASSWSIYQFPRWLEISPKQGEVDAGSPVELNFDVLREEMLFDLGVYSFPLAFNVEQVGVVVQTVVILNYGIPEIIQTPSVVEADASLQGTYTVINSGYGILFWQIINKPQWLTIYPIEGSLGPYDYGIWEYSINAEGLGPGNYSGKVEILTNTEKEYFSIEFRFSVR